MRTQHGAESGSALLPALMASIVLVGLSAAMATVSTSTRREYAAAHMHLERMYVAEGGIALSMLDLTHGGTGNIGSSTSPVPLGATNYWVTATPNADGSHTLTSVARSDGRARAFGAIVREVGGGAFQHAMFAGNSSGDATYSLDIGGTGVEADVINGDIYSGQDVGLTGDASITGTIRAGGTITGGSGEEGVSQPLPGIGDMNYEVDHDVNVAAEFTAHATYETSAHGGDGWQVPEDKFSHIFRMNPSDRSGDWSATSKDDYFLEDPYEAVGPSPVVAYADAEKLSLSGAPGKPGVDGNGLVYFIDGNLWIHNRPYLSVGFETSDPVGTQVTFVVKGNVYFSDNVLLQDPARDGVAFIAIEDAAVPDSGNIYFGDPVGGTLEKMEAFMYAENDFHDNNLDAAGSTDVTVNGIMSAGNQVAINRDGPSGHSRLELNFDDRVATGALDLPGLPTIGMPSPYELYEIVSSSELPAGGY